MHSLLDVVIAYVFGKVGFQLGDTLAPVGGRFLRNQLDIEERSLAGAVNVARSGTSYDAWRYVRYDVLK